MPDFDWNDLPAFLSMARQGRLAAAARQRGVDHSTLSRRIAALEAALGARLFDRRPSGFVLTAEGEALLADAEAIEALTQRMRARLQSGRASLSGSVRIGTPEGFGTYFLAPRLPALADAHPALDIDLVAGPSAFSLSKREADLAISMARPTQGRVYAHKLVDYALGLYAAAGYLAARPALRSREDLAQQRWVGYVDELMWSRELDYLPQVGRGITPRLHISNVISQMAALAGGAGIGVLPHFMARHEPRLQAVLPQEVQLQRTYWLVSHPDTRELARIRTTMDFLVQVVADAGADFWSA